MTTSGEQMMPAEINARLAELLGKKPAALASASVETLDDRLWVWGILGGKEVGKSTLINAIGGREIVSGGEVVGEGTFQPAAYFHKSDREALLARFGSLDSSISVSYHADGPESMRGLVLVDLPDFDSLYHDHTALVRRIAGKLDGIIWVTTPKKIGDQRAIVEIQRVLKARTNFAYVVNKIDWLLGQSDERPQDALDRVADALRSQIRESDPDGSVVSGAFVISARYRSTDAILKVIAESRNSAESESPASTNGEMLRAAERVLGEFDALRKALTTAPSPEAIEANKRANRAYQMRAHVRELNEHYRPQWVLERLGRASNGEALEELVCRAFPAAYCDQVLRRLHSEKALFSKWSTSLFKRRIAYWPWLGIVAWPVAALTGGVGGLRRLWPGSTSGGGDPFRFDGMTLDERVAALCSAVSSRCARVFRRAPIRLAAESDVLEQFRSEVHALADAQRSAAVQPFFSIEPSPAGQLARTVFPAAVLIWFPLVQPMLSSALRASDAGAGFASGAFRMLVDALSAASVLTGLGVSLVILLGAVAAVYSAAARDVFRALDALQSPPPGVTSDPLVMSLLHTVRRPIEEVRSEVGQLVDRLNRLESDATAD